MFSGDWEGILCGKHVHSYRRLRKTGKCQDPHRSGTGAPWGNLGVTYVGCDGDMSRRFVLPQGSTAMAPTARDADKGGDIGKDVGKPRCEGLSAEGTQQLEMIEWIW